MFGNLEGAATIRCPISIKTTSQVHLLQINSKAFFNIISEFPEVLKLLHSYRPSNEVCTEILLFSLNNTFRALSWS